MNAEAISFGLRVKVPALLTESGQGCVYVVLPEYVQSKYFWPAPPLGELGVATAMNLLRASGTIFLT